jgi:phage tail-like protein
MPSRRNNFRYLNREGKWLNFHWRGLEVSAQGALQLRSSPRLADQSASPTTGVAAPVAPSGIAVDDSGRVFYSIPQEHSIVAGGGCDPAQTPLKCLTEGAGLCSLNTPRGLLVLRNPERLVIADSGNDRLLFCDLLNFDLREVWGQASLGAWPSPPDAPDRFNDPWAVAADEDSQNVYVLDAGNQRILKFARTGDPDTDFITQVQESGLVQHPGALAVGGRGEETRIFVSDLTANAIYVFDAAGAPVLDAQCLPVAIEWPGMGSVFALALSETTLYVGDNDQQRILSFGLEDGFPFSGEAAGFHGYVTALLIDSRSGRLLAQTGDDAKPLSLESRGAYLSSGVLWSEAISAGDSPVVWNRLRASVKNAPGSHVEFYYALSHQPAVPPVHPTADDPFSDARWQVLLQDVEDFLLGVGRNLYLFVGARFFSDRTGTPLLTQMRADFDTESYTRYLPAIYREPAAESDFLRRFVSLFQGLFEDIEDEVESLERYFDAFAVPAEALTWLATWLAVELDQNEPEARIRQSIARAFRRYQWRGTIEGLRLALLEDAGVHATISEPIAASSFWANPPAAGCGGSTGGIAAPQLGMGTHLSSMEPGGAVLGSTAELDHSYLITDAQFGEPIFEGAAWQFIVEVYRGEVNTDERMQLVKEIIEREKPAHTMYRLALIDSRMRAGFQARAGVDTIISGTSGATPLGHDGGVGLRLGGALPPRIGTSHLGEDLKL